MSNFVTFEAQFVYKLFLSINQRLYIAVSNQDLCEVLESFGEISAIWGLENVKNVRTKYLIEISFNVEFSVVRL